MPEGKLKSILAEIDIKISQAARGKESFRDKTGVTAALQFSHQQGIEFGLLQAKEIILLEQLKG